MIPEWLFPTIISIIVGNILVWVFLWGRASKRLDTNENDVKNLKEDVKGERGCRMEWEKEMKQSHLLLPECVQMFTKISEGLANLNGKVETILSTIRDGGGRK